MEHGDPQALAFFNRSAVAIGADGSECRFSEEDFRKLNEGNYWHHKHDPSSWLCSSTVYRARNKFGARLKRKDIIRLCADTLNITPKKLEESLDWNANYLAFHDGTTAEENHPYLPNEP
jgi:hypothetical protein